MTVFYVGGPNVRRDYHIEEGEEFFYMLRGDMVLKVLERGRAKDVVIREGEVFLLPGRIAHSPQRLADTVGLVVERERASHEQDCLRFYTDDTCSQVLHERWVYCKDLYHDLVPLINEFLGSEQCRTNRPGPGSFLGKPAYDENTETTLSPPFNLNQWLQRHDNLLSQPNAKRLVATLKSPSGFR
ncbi:3-hydroxyanthranilate 3,4-dioxygenase, putative [Ixodes scapularis]|uniref:3-hydroxyanthranilate 3,4-dioxygenase, putative n=1 Tax=Ixodes scapularis TaxID=6945 RepID=B7PU50_IXOSC|nr:3-hydroxyanthranilate 3,4-dioxygenase, putative [Ixodes scapularis]|eukprot:XP_002405525.1 3-hydroxyanthranilate 3,4-dioxygenase, putative [Ixodes scapularis]